MVVRLAAGNALLQPRSGGTLRLEPPPAAIGMQVGSDFIALLAQQPRPLGVKAGGAACNPFVRFHGGALSTFCTGYKHSIREAALVYQPAHVRTVQSM